MTIRRAFAAACLAVALPSSAAAQPPLAIRGYGVFGIATLAATDTFDAVAGTTTAPIVGGGAQAALWRGLFADVAVSWLSIEGERIFVDAAGTVFQLGIPLEVTMRPVDLAAGWRISFGRITPYAGAGVTFLSYEETSSFAEAAEDVSESGTGMLVLGGADVRVWRWVHAGGELRYRRVRGILGEEGASAEFGEDDAGGFSAAVRVSIGR